MSAKKIAGAAAMSKIASDLDVISDVIAALETQLELLDSLSLSIASVRLCEAIERLKVERALIEVQ